MRKKSHPATRLRAQAETQLANNTPSEMPARSAEELLHELQVHQIELEMQNKALRQTQLALEESRDHYIELYEFSPVAYLTLDQHGMIQKANLTASTLLGYERGKLLRKRFTSLVEPEYCGRWNHLFMEMVQQQGSRTFDLVLNKKDGDTLHTQLNCVHIIQQGHLPVIRLTITDITALRKAEEAAHEWQQLIDCAHWGMSIGDMEDRLIKRANPAFARMHGYTQEELYYLNTDQLYAPESRGLIPGIQEILRDTNAYTFECMRLRKDGSTFPAMMDISTIRHGVNKLFFIANVTDISVYKQLEAHTIEVQENLRATLDAIPDLLFEVGLDGRYYDYRTSHPELLTSHPEKIIGKTIHDTLSAEPVNVIMQALHEANETGSSFGKQIYLQLPQGHMWFELSISRKNNSSLNEPRFIVLSRDITKRKQAELKNAALIHHNQVLMDSTSEGIHILDNQGNILEANEAFCRHLGYTHDETLKLNVLDWEAKFSETELQAAFIQLRNSHAVFETRHRRKDGTLVDVEVNVNGVRLDGQDCFLSLSRVITKRKQAEALLRKSAEEINDLYNNAPCGYHSLDKNGIFRRINDTELAWLGYTREEILNRMSFTDLLAPESQHSFSDKFSQLLQQGQVRDIEAKIVRKDGTAFDVIINATAIYDADGNFSLTRSMMFDVTERRRAELMQRESEEKYRLLFENSRDALMVLAPPSWRFISANRSTLKMFGANCEDEFTALHPWDISPELQPDGTTSVVASQQMIDTAMQDGSHFFEWAHRRLDGTSFPAEVLLTRQDRGGNISLQATVRDINERKRLEREVRERRNEMDELQKMHIAAMTTAALAHELNQPLLAIASYCEAACMLLAAEPPDLNKVRKAVTGSERQAQRAGQAIRVILELLSLKEFTAEILDLNTEILTALATAKSEYELLFNFELNLESGLPPVLVNRIHFQKVLLNLLSNSIEAMQESNVKLPSILITVRTHKDGAVALITISDNGPGFREEDVPRLFEPFFTSKDKGIGMGLAISRSLLESNGGQLWIAPEEGPGATFHLTIPFAS